MHMDARVQTHDFDARDELSMLRAHGRGGALVSFVGLVRDSDSGERVQQLLVEHYEGMTQRCMMDIMERAAARWPLLAMRVVHRVGSIGHGEQIVFAGVLATHRKDAFDACSFVVDHLKTSAPLWKAEHDGVRRKWVCTRGADQERQQAWHRQ